MHGRLYNEAEFTLRLRPRTPLLIKSGAVTSLSPEMPDMAFVRTRRRDKHGEEIEEIYLPGASVRGVVRAYAESLLRSIDLRHACDPFKMSRPKETDTPGLHAACLADKKPTDLNGPQAWKGSCCACKLFGNTGLSSRLRVSDFYIDGDEPLTETRHGVAIDRITGAVAQGPFELETVTDGEFSGTVTLRNFTTGQLALLAAALLDLSDGLVAIGHAKSRGLGRVELFFDRLTFRFPLKCNPAGRVSGIGALADSDSHSAYSLPDKDKDWLKADAGFIATPKGVFDTLTLEDDEAARVWLDEIMTVWVAQLGT